MVAHAGPVRLVTRRGATLPGLLPQTMPGPSAGRHSRASRAAARAASAFAVPRSSSRFALRDHRVLRVARRGHPGVEDAEAGRGRRAEQRGAGHRGDHPARPAARAPGECRTAPPRSRRWRRAPAPRVMYAPPRPVWYGSATIPMRRVIRSKASISMTWPSSARLRAGPDSAGRRGEQAEPARGHRGRAGEHERHLPVAVVPGGHGGVADQRGGVGGHGRAEHRRARGGRGARPAAAARSARCRPPPRRRARTPLSSQVPTLIGEVTLNTRIMLRNRAGRPRSCTSAASDTRPARERPGLRRPGSARAGR